MFVSFDNGQHWQSLQQNLPNTPVTDIACTARPRAVDDGRSFWIMDDVSPLHQLASRHELVMRRRRTCSSRARPTACGTRRRPHRPTTAVPRRGRRDRLLPGRRAGRGAEARDHRLQRRRCPHLHAQPGAQEPETRAPTMGGKAGRRRGAAVHGARVAQPFRLGLEIRRRRGRGRPLVVPGTYQVRLSAGEWSQSRPLECASILVRPRTA